MRIRIHYVLNKKKKKKRLKRISNFFTSDYSSSTKKMMNFCVNLILNIQRYFYIFSQSFENGKKISTISC